MSGLCEEAYALARALELGLFGVSEAVAWADARLFREDRPPLALCEVSLAMGRDAQDVATFLRRCPGTPDNSEVRRLLTTLLKNRLKADPDQADRVAAGLYELAMAEEIELPRLSDIAQWASDALELAAAGYIDESREQIVRTMEDALDEAAGDSTMPWPFVMAGKEPDTPSP